MGAYAQVSVGWKEIYASGEAFSLYRNPNAFALISQEESNVYEIL